MNTFGHTLRSWMDHGGTYFLPLNILDGYGINGHPHWNTQIQETFHRLQQFMPDCLHDSCQLNIKRNVSCMLAALWLPLVKYENNHEYDSDWFFEVLAIHQAEGWRLWMFELYPRNNHGTLFDIMFHLHFYLYTISYRLFGLWITLFIATWCDILHHTAACINLLIFFGHHSYPKFKFHFFHWCWLFTLFGVMFTDIFDEYLFQWTMYFVEKSEHNNIKGHRIRCMKYHSM